MLPIPEETKQEITRIIRGIVATGKLFVILHYTGVNADTSASAIKWYHKIKLGWSRDGYHDFINHDGKIENLEPVWARVNGCKSTGKSTWNPWSKYPSNEYYVGVNAYQICYETLTGLKMPDMVESVLIHFFTELVKAVPNIQIGGHREFPDFTAPNKRQQTACPGVSVSDWLLNHAIPLKNIFYESTKI